MVHTDPEDPRRPQLGAKHPTEKRLNRFVVSLNLVFFMSLMGCDTRAFRKEPAGCVELEQMVFRPPRFPLPAEVLQLIFLELVDRAEYLSIELNTASSNSNGTGPLPRPDSRVTLATGVALTCRPFYSLAMGILWEHLVVRSTETLSGLLQTSESVQSQQRINIPIVGESPLPQRTRRLDLQISGDYNHRQLGSLISRLSKLEILIFSNGCSQRGPAFRIPKIVVDAVVDSCPKLRRLQFRSLFEQPTIFDLVRIAGKCRNIQTLQIAAIDPLCPPKLPSSSTSGTPLFQSLHTLSLGAGWAHFPSLSRIQLQFGEVDTPNFTEFLRILSLHTNHLPVLRQVHLLMELDLDANQTFVDKLRAVVAVCLCGSAWRLRGGSSANWATFSNLKWLVVVLEPYFDPLPNEIHTVEGVEIIQPGADLSGEDTMLATQITLLDLSRVGSYHSLRKVVLRATDLYNDQQDWNAHYGPLFQERGVVFKVVNASTHPPAHQFKVTPAAPRHSLPSVLTWF